MYYKKKKNMVLRHLINAPFIWSILIPLFVLDIFVEIYHQIGFRLCGIELVDRSKYVRIDRHKLKYLNLFNKIACAYCGYANGLVAYFMVIAARSEKYWCAIQHKKGGGFIPPRHHKNFVTYGDEKEFKRRFAP